MKAFALGRYVPGDSWLHRLDPRLKILSTILLMVCVFLNYSSWTMRYAMMGVMFLIISVLLWMTKMSFRSVLSSLRHLWFMVVFVLIIYILMPSTVHVLPLAWDLNGWVVYWDSFAEAGRILLRLVMMVELTLILTASTKPLDLTYALEWYLTPLKVFHFPSAEAAMTLSLALRFIPTLLEDTTRVMKAQSSRGVDFEHGSLWKRLMGVTSLVIPLFVSSFMRSEELANAMECRGYDPRAKRTRYHILRFHWRDLLGFVLVAGLFAFCVTTVAMGLDYFALAGLEVL